MSPGEAGAEGRTIVAVADSDSFVKWAAALLGSQLDMAGRILLVRTPLTVSPEQEAAALAGSGVGSDQVERVDYHRLQQRLEVMRPDAVVVAGRGPFVRVVLRKLAALAPRPVVVVGLPGISIPAQRGALLYRRRADLFLVHSRREQRAFIELSAHLGIDMEFALATLPFARRSDGDAPGGSDLVFAAQAVVPRSRRERSMLAGILREAALADPGRRVVVKLRSRADAGEKETHREVDSYPDLLAELGELPPNVVFSHAPMREVLRRAEGLVTVSSTAAIEALGAGVPVIAVDTFGLSKSNLNIVFTGSGLLGGSEDVVRRRFRFAASRWMADNYFHPEDDSSWRRRLDQLIALSHRDELPMRPEFEPRGGWLQRSWERKSVLGYADRTASGLIALVLGVPLQWLVRRGRRLRRGRGRHSWADPASDITVTPAPHQEAIRIRRPAHSHE